MTLYPLNKIIPPIGAMDIQILQLTVFGDQQPTLNITEIDFNKDCTEPTGSGTITLPYTLEAWDVLPKYSEIQVDMGWESADDNNVQTVFNGYISDKEHSGTEINLSIVDKGTYLEQKANVSYTNEKRSTIIRKLIEMVGLIPNIDFTGVTDDTLSYSSASSSTGVDSAATGACVCFSGKPSCNFHCGPYVTVNKCYKNYCPSCKKPGTLINKHKPTAAGEQEITCSACDADYCINCGICKSGKANPPRLTACSSSATGTQNPTEAVNTDTTSTDTTSSDSSSSTTTTSSTTSDGKSIWDMLIDLCDPVGHDLQVFVWLNTVYVQPVPDPSTAQLWIDEELNLQKDSLDIKEGEPDVVNTVTINYGSSALPQQVTLENKRLTALYQPVTKTINKYNMNEEEATNYGKKFLANAERDSGFSLDCTVLGHPEWYIGRWAACKLGSNGIEDTLFITKINPKIGKDLYIVDLSLGQYLPTINSSNQDISVASKAGSTEVTSLAKALGSPKACRVWIDANIDYEKYSGHRHDPEDVLSRKKANCWDQADLFVAMVTTLGYSAHRRCGQVCNGIAHCDAQLSLNGSWITVDTTCHKRNQL